MDTAAATGHVRNGRGTLRPYVYGPPALLEFVTQTFGADLVERSPDGGEVELRVGDSMIALALGEDFPTDLVTRASIYVYVPDADTTYERALAAGATPLAAPEDKPYQERLGTVRDGFGNIWFISTYHDGRP
ncbi:MAG TPA: VOC family protein [Cryptosporangiaceae bacterium]|nr:VOC family protein [Cryptosporangiaceae bacterium]